jgi:hypothetical protein
MNCADCGKVLEGEEVTAPCYNLNEEPVCDECYYGNYVFTCCWCEEYEHIKNRDAIGNLIVVFDAEEAGIERAGIYKITKHPYYTHNYLNAWLNKYAIERVADLPSDIQPYDYAVGHLCQECQVKIESTLLPV